MNKEHPNYLEQESSTETSHTILAEEGDTVEYGKGMGFVGDIRRIFEEKDEKGDKRKVAEIFMPDGKMFSAPLDKLVVIKKRK